MTDRVRDRLAVEAEAEAEADRFAAFYERILAGACLVGDPPVEPLPRDARDEAARLLAQVHEQHP